jgi:hypothetical protein
MASTSCKTGFFWLDERRSYISNWEPCFFWLPQQEKAIARKNRSKKVNASDQAYLSKRYALSTQKCHSCTRESGTKLKKFGEITQLTFEWLNMILPIKTWRIYFFFCLALPVEYHRFRGYIPRQVVSNFGRSNKQHLYINAKPA